MKSLYKRQFVMMAGMILVSFALLGAAFITLSYRYTVQEKRDSMERNADYIAAFTSAMYSSGFNVRDDGYQVYVSSIARISDAYVLVTAADGQVILSADGNTISTGSTRLYRPKAWWRQVQKDGRFTGITTLGGLFPEKRYVAGTPVQVNALDLTTGQTRAEDHRRGLHGRRIPPALRRCGGRSPPSSFLPPWWCCASPSSPAR